MRKEEMIKKEWTDLDDREGEKRREGRYQKVAGSQRLLFLDKFVLEELVLEPEIGFLALAPGALVVKVDICSLLIVVGDSLWFLMALEPCQVLLVKPPRLLLQLPCRQVPRGQTGRVSVRKTFFRLSFRNPKFSKNDPQELGTYCW